MSVLSYLQGRASAGVLSTSEKTSVATSITTLQSRLASHFNAGQLSNHFTFGSYTRETILPRAMDAHSDIDYMIVFAEGGYQPQTYLDRLRKFVEAKYSTSELYQSSPTIVLELNHIKFELVPALAQLYGGYNIPSGPAAWQFTNPNDFNSSLTVKNQANGYQIKPVIRLLKAWNAKSGYVFNSYLLEKWVVDLTFWSCTSLKDYLFFSFDQMSVSTSTQWQKNAIERAKANVAQIRKYEADSMPASAESEVKKLIPE